MTNHALVTTGFLPELPIELWHQCLGCEDLMPGDVGTPQ